MRRYGIGLAEGNKTKQAGQAAEFTFSFNLTHLIQLKHSGWVHLPVQMAVDRWGEGGRGAGVREHGERGSMQEHHPHSLTTSLKSHSVHSAGLYQ